MKSLLTLISLLFILTSIPAFAEPTSFSDEGENITVQLPEEWYSKIIDDGKTVQLFISREEVVEESDMFEVGATLNKIRRMSKSFEQMKTDADIVNMWYNGGVAQFKTYHVYEEVSREIIQIGDYKGVVSEVIFQPTEGSPTVHMYNCVLAYDDNLVTVVLEAYEDEWEDYKGIFAEVLNTLELK